MEREIKIITPDGQMQAYLFLPEGKGPWPTVIHMMDGLGLRPAFKSVSERIAAQGYAVVSPNLFYRKIAPRELDFATELPLIRELLKTVSRDAFLSDFDAFIHYLESEPAARSDWLAVVGYCMSGKHALNAAATWPGRVVAALSFHGGALATDSPESPHRFAARMKGRIYCGVAQDDFDKDPSETARLRGAMEGASVNAEIELYDGCKHGWTIPNNAVYDPEGSKKHFDSIFNVLKLAL
jgi:carboxymethylenebutenolidase